MNITEKRLRLEELNRLLDGSHTYQPHEEGVLLHEALGLCEDLGLDRAWCRFKALLERLQQAQFQVRKQERAWTREDDTDEYEEDDYS